jgi:hypothetical protein
MKCVVCGNGILDGTEAYANSWEKIEKTHPCCSAKCAAAFNPDIHWLPATKPAEPSEEDTSKLLAIASARLGGGDEPGPIVRELLCAGVEPHRVRGALNGALGEISYNERQSETEHFLFLIPLKNLFRAVFGRSGKSRKIDKINAAYADIDIWLSRYKDEHETDTL